MIEAVTKSRWGRRAVAMGLLAGVLAGCASPGMSRRVEYGPMADETITSHLDFVPPAGRSGLYVIRAGGVVGMALAYQADLDGAMLARLYNDSFVYASIAPGEHNLRVVNQGAGYTFTADADKNYFFLVKTSLTGNEEQISEDRGRELVKEYAARLR